jgi:hypothetical protein
MEHNEASSRAIEAVHRIADSTPAKLTIGGAGVGIGMMEIVHWSQVISAIGGALVVLLTLVGILYKFYKWVRGLA